GTEVRSSFTSNSTLVAITDADRITLEDVDVHGHDNLSLRRCVLGNGTHISVLNSSLTGCHIKGFDSQAFLSVSGAGPYWLEGNVLEGAGENIMFGGADPASADHVPSDITIRNNIVRKPPEWFTSGKWSVKNLFEIKTAVRVLVENNLFENTWDDAQRVAINIKSVNQNGGAHGAWSKATDITFRRNTIRNFPWGISLAAAPEPPVAEVLSRVLIEDNIFENGGHDNPYGGAPTPRAIQILSDIRDLTVRHNEWHGSYQNQVAFEGGGKTNFVFENNIIGEATYGFQNASNLLTMAPGAVVTGNILAPATYNNSLPGGNCIIWPPSAATSCSSAGRR
ncbi:MAG: hypothetical protein HKO65_04290, partial [Gemmatimonadetes bacterium]|nr:hypothetical protein [Gemmatimonadota bacterium]